MPLIGVVNSWGENNPGAKHIDTLAKMAKAGIEAAGGAPMEFCISSLCAGMATGGLGDRYCLGYRHIVTAFIEIMTGKANQASCIPVTRIALEGRRI